ARAGCASKRIRAPRRHVRRAEANWHRSAPPHVPFGTRHLQLGAPSESGTGASTPRVVPRGFAPTEGSLAGNKAVFSVRLSLETAKWSTAPCASSYHFCVGNTALEPRS